MPTDCLEKIVLPSYSTPIDEELMEEISLGPCLSILYKGPFSLKGRIGIREKLGSIREYIKREKLNPRGEIIVKSIISAYIIKDESEHLYEFLVPLGK